MRRMEVRRGGEEEDGLREKERERRLPLHQHRRRGNANAAIEHQMGRDGMGWEVVSKKRQHKRARTHLSLSLSLSLHNAVVKSEKKRERTAKGRE